MNKYLEKIASTRLIREIAKNPGKFNVSKLTRQGYIRTPETYIQRIHEGTEAIASKHHATLHEPVNQEEFVRTLFAGGHRFDSVAHHHPTEVASITSKITHLEPNIVARLFSPLQRVFSSKNRSKLVHAVGNRHEAHEVKEMSRQWLDRVKNSVQTGGPMPQNMGNVSRKGRPTGEHANLSVLMRESNDIRKIPHQNLLSSLHKARSKTGESELLKRITGKGYGEHFTPADIRKGVSARPTLRIGDKWYHES
jgi:hypothetical protein